MVFTNIKLKKKAPGNYQIKIRQSSGALQSQTPITIKGMVPGIKKLSDIGDVNEVALVDGATLVYNEDTSRYEIKKLDADLLDGDFDLDCGEF